MLKLTKLDGKTFYLNSFWIETVEATPDTVITYAGGKKVIVKENTEEIIETIQALKRNIRVLNA
ncbi:MAG: flagellar FlbD family protein [Bacillota bacterium]|jgi:flagellar protein FlbD|nr:flagellar FlbD family protein [Bacillota bacterium]NLU54545.1 flagellar FlbD family protein [Bacillota bacterium]HOA91102.1 flagellar FlbD family protein [Bacillota bacterium]HOP53414.1 flagellar FlbD family protein [Bacillota bacterium]HPQ11322.1 flagellar FlbD family protein [Bacillota bacterium]